MTAREPVEPATESAGDRPRPVGFAGRTGWILFDWASQPFFTLVQTFLFAPYFVNVLVGDPVHGQALWGYAAAAAGLIVALTSPALGAIADASGRRKPYVAVCSVGLVVGCALLWLAEPGPDLNLTLIFAAVVLATVAVEFATVFTNAMMPSLVPDHQLGRLSGTGWAVGYIGGLVSLVIVAGLLVADAASGRTLLGLEPLLALDAARHEGERLVGPFSALWYVVFVLPLFLFTPDRNGMLVSAAPVRDGLRRLVETLKNVRQYSVVVRFLIARMLYVDGLGAIFAFGGLYGASLFAWGPMQLGLFGIVLALAGSVGALAGGWLDDRFGAKSVIMVTLAFLSAGAIGVVSVDRESVFFVLDVAAPAEGRATFASAGEQVYLFFAVVIGIMAGPLQSASRSLLARLAPREMVTEFFGLYAFSGKITAFAAPFLVASVTAASGNQRAGIAVILVFLLGGLALMWTVREPDGK
ncbi:MAG: MFS transporter [Hyphomicrobiales bacterium]|nr:MFS transporter [Hyphomicrobiales bacterium]